MTANCQPFGSIVCRPKRGSPPRCSRATRTFTLSKSRGTIETCEAKRLAFAHERDQQAVGPGLKPSTTWRAPVSSASAGEVGRGAQHGRAAVGHHVGRGRVGIEVADGPQAELAAGAAAVARRVRRSGRRRRSASAGRSGRFMRRGFCCQLSTTLAPDEVEGPEQPAARQQRRRLGAGLEEAPRRAIREIAASDVAATTLPSPSTICGCVGWRTGPGSPSARRPARSSQIRVWPSPVRSSGAAASAASGRGHQREDVGGESQVAPPGPSNSRWGSRRDGIYWMISDHPARHSEAGGCTIHRPRNSCCAMSR